MVSPSPLGGSRAVADLDPALDAALDLVSSRAAGWADAPVADVLALVRESLQATASVADEWVQACAAAKHVESSPAAAEEWSLGPLPTARFLRLLERSLTDIAAGSRPRLFGPPRPGPGSRTRVPVLHSDRYDRLLFPGFAAEAWLPGRRSPAEIAAGQAAAFFGAGDPGATVVLGAGNVSAIPAADAVEMLVVRRRTVLLKLSPVNDYLAPVLGRALAPFVRRGVLAVVRGAADAGARLVSDRRARFVHVTGSAATWRAVSAARTGAGLGMDGSTAELGNVTPVIVVPGTWSRSQLRYQAENVAMMIVNNGGFNCAAARVLVTSGSWPQRGEFLGCLAAALRQVPARYPYYPGAESRLAEVRHDHPDALRLGSGPPEATPWLLVPGLDALDADERLFREECFAPVLAEVPLGTGSAQQHLRAATQWANEQLCGDLCAGIVVDPRTRLRPGVRRALGSAVADLRYGTVAVNHWPAMSYAFGSVPWGPYGRADGRSASGVGVVHNSQMLPDVEKVVLRGPFRVRPRPVWFPGHRNGYQAGRRLTRLQARPSVSGLGAVARAAIGP
ncbi:MAG: aldehyde dehydrogenase family protein [Mycobacteriales bacterium]